MAIIKDLGQLKPIIETGKAVQKLADTAASNEDGWAKFERIVTSIDHMLDSMIKLKNEQNGQGANTRAILPEPSRENISRGNQAKNANNIEGNKMKIPPQVIDFFDKFIADCVKENPNMTIGEAMMKLPINVTQLSALIQIGKRGLK